MAGQEVCVGMFDPSDVGVCVCVVDVILFTTRMGHDPAARCCCSLPPGWFIIWSQHSFFKAFKKFKYIQKHSSLKTRMQVFRFVCRWSRSKNSLKPNQRTSRLIHATKNRCLPALIGCSSSQLVKKNNLCRFRVSPDNEIPQPLHNRRLLWGASAPLWSCRAVCSASARLLALIRIISSRTSNGCTLRLLGPARCESFHIPARLGTDCKEPPKPLTLTSANKRSFLVSPHSCCEQLLITFWTPQHGKLCSEKLMNKVLFFWFKAESQQQN